MPNRQSSPVVTAPYNTETGDSIHWSKAINSTANCVNPLLKSDCFASMTIKALGEQIK